MSLQAIVAQSESFGINDHRVIGQTVSRSLHILTSEIMSAQPFSFTFKPHNYMRFSQSRQILQALRKEDRLTEQTINLAVTGWKSIIAYQGTLPNTAVLYVNSTPTETTFNWSATGLVSGATYTVFKAGDLVQWGRYAYYIVSDVTATVAAASSAVSGVATVHRTILQTVTSSTQMAFGERGITTVGGVPYAGVTFPVIVREYPTYTLKPITNDSFIEWDGSFSVMENIIA